MADQPELYRACRTAPTEPGAPFRARAVYLEPHDHAAVSGAVWTACGLGAYDVLPLPFLAELRAFRRPPRCPACLAAATTR